MVGKFFVLAFACVSLVQGNELENAINKAVIKLETLNHRAEVKLDRTIEEHYFKIGTVESRSFDLTQQSRNLQKKVKDALRTLAQTVEDKAKETQKPPSVFECIMRAEINAHKQIQTIINQFVVDIENLKNASITKIKTIVGPLEGMEADLKKRFDRDIAVIHNCKTERCVTMAVNSYTRWFDMVLDDIKRSLDSTVTISGNFERDARTSFNDVSRQINRIQVTSSNSIRGCLYRPGRIFEEEH